MRLGRFWTTATAAAPCLWFAGFTNAETAAVRVTFGDQRRQQAAGGAADASRSREGQASPPLPRGGGKKSTTATLELQNDGVPDVLVGPTCGPSALYNRTIDPSRYQFGCTEIEGMITGPKTLITSGNSRKVFLVKYEGVELVLKTTKHQSAKTSKRHHMEAIALDVVLGAPYIAPSLGFCQTSSVQPYFVGGTVEEHIGKAAWTGEPFGVEAVLQMSLDAMRGLAAFHEAPGGPIIHNAMRPEQLLVYDNGTVVVSDLNSCNFMGAEEGTGARCPTKSHIHHNARWNAPELYGHEGYTEKIDIFSMGIIFWQLMSLRTIPFEGWPTKSVPDLVKTGQRPHVDDSWDPGYAQLMQDMWAMVPEARPSAREVAARLEEMRG